MVQLRVAGRVLSELRGPSRPDQHVPILPLSRNKPYHLSDESLLRRLIRRERAQQRQQPAFACSVWLELRLIVRVHQEQAQVSTTASLTCFQQQLRAGEE